MKQQNTGTGPPFTKGGKHFPLFQRGSEGDFRIGAFETANGIRATIGIRTKIALNLESFYRLQEQEALNPADVVNLAYELGVDGVELSVRLVTLDREPKLFDALDSTGIEVVSCYVFSNLLTTDADIRQQQVQAIQSGLERVSRFRTGRALIIPGVLPDGVDADAAREWIIEALKQCVPTATDLGLQLTIENVGFQAAVYGRARDVQSICDSVGPEMKVISITKS